MQVASTKNPEAPGLDELQGDLAAAQRRWSDAAEHYKTALENTKENGKWLLSTKYLMTCVRSSGWKQYYEESDEPEEAFQTLARRQITEQRWKDFTELLQWHLQQGGRGIDRDSTQAQVAAAAARAAWACQEYAKCAQFCDLALGESRQPAFRRGVPSTETLDEEEIQSLRELKSEALLYLDDLRSARQAAKKLSDPDDQLVMQAAIAAAQGESQQAMQLANQAEEQSVSLGRLYHHEYAGTLFLRDAYQELRAKERPSLPYQLISQSGVFFLKEPLELNEEQVKKALRSAQQPFLGNRKKVFEQLNFQMMEMRLFTIMNSHHYGPNHSQTMHRIEDQYAQVFEAKSATEADVKFFVCTYDEASIWFATGIGEYDSKWRLAGEVKDSGSSDQGAQAWFAVGVVAWSKHHRERVEDLARRTARALVGDRATYFCSFNTSDYADGDFPRAAYVASPNALEAWEHRIPQHRVGSTRVHVEQAVVDDKVVANRQQRQLLASQVKEWQAEQGGELHVLLKFSENRINTSLWAVVDEVTEEYGSMTLKVRLLETSKLLPVLREGLLLSLDPTEIERAKIEKSGEVKSLD